LFKKQPSEKRTKRNNEKKTRYLMAHSLLFNDNDIEILKSCIRDAWKKI
jgi:hypothetical protein